MANQRSPNCPQITFEEAAAKGRLVYEKEHTHPSPKEVVAQSLGYSGINGRSLSMIGALRQYGILDGSGEALRVTEDAVAYFELEGGAERTGALVRMVFQPPFFAQIRADFPDQLPSEANLKHYLIRHGFLPDAAANVIRVYRENIRLVEDTSKRYTGGQVPEAEPMTTGMTTITPLNPLNTVNFPPPQPSLTGKEVPLWSQSFALSKNAMAELTIRGDVNAGDLKRLKTYIDITIEALAGDSLTEQASPKAVSSPDESGEGTV